MIMPEAIEMKEIRGTVWAHSPTTWDPRFGYSWNNTPNRMLRAAHGEIVADNSYEYNNYHQHCTFDYSAKKSSLATYRFVVLGDSFTNDIMLPVAWPETLQRLLNSRKEFKTDFEVYGFPTDGGGLVNWHATFTELIDKQFDYDALIIADWGDDLFRDWIIIYSSEKKVHAIRVDPTKKPQTLAEVEALATDDTVMADIMPEEEIDALASRLKANAAPRLMTPQDYSGGYGGELPPLGYEFSRQAFVARYGDLRYGMMDEMVQTCKSKGKQVIYSPLPTRRGLLDLKSNGKRLMPQVQGEGLCKHFGIRYFDGFDALADIASQSLIDLYWMKYDGHWNLGASMHYALKLAGWILSDKAFQPD